MSKVANVERLMEVFEELLEDDDFLKDTVAFVVLDTLDSTPRAKELFVAAANVRMLSKAHKNGHRLPVGLKLSNKFFRDTANDDFVEGFTHACAFFIVREICRKHGTVNDSNALRNALFDSTLEQINDFADFEYKEEYGEKK